MPANNVRDVDKGFEDLHAFLKNIGVSLTVGIHEEDSEPYVRGQSEPVTIAQVAAFHEFGAPKANIPKRSFLRSTVDENAGDYADKVEATIDLAMDALGTGELTELVELEMNLLGEEIVGDVQAKIVDIDSPPPADDDNDNLLVKSSQMLRSIDHQVHTSG